MLFHSIIVAFALALTSVSGSDSAPDWTYKSSASGLAAPAQWASAHSTCGGARQSPIDIATRPLVEKLAMPLQFTGECAQYNVTQHYDAFKAEVQGGSCAVELRDKAFALAQVHFHTPSEHKINGKALDGEAHLVHKAPDGSIVVVGLFLKATSCGATDSFATKLIDALDYVEEDAPSTVSLHSIHRVLQTAMANGRTFNYAGSLTSPTCSEVVDWWVIEKPLAVSKSELAALRRNFKRIKAADEGKNARPTQPLNGRTIAMY